MNDKRKDHSNPKRSRPQQLQTYKTSTDDVENPNSTN